MRVAAGETQDDENREVSLFTPDPAVLSAVPAGNRRRGSTIEPNENIVSTGREQQPRYGLALTKRSCEPALPYIMKPDPSGPGLSEQNCIEPPEILRIALMSTASGCLRRARRITLS